MIKRKLIAAAVLSTIGLSGCVSPEIVASQRVEDTHLSCHDIGLQMQQLSTIRAQVKKGKTVSGANVAAAVFFWSAVIGNYANAHEAMQAANAREDFLAQLAHRQGCRFE